MSRKAIKGSSNEDDYTDKNTNVFFLGPNEETSPTSLKHFAFIY